METKSLGNVRFTKLLTVIIMLIIGIALVVAPGESSTLIVQGIGVVMLLFAVAMGINFLRSKEKVFSDKAFLIVGIVIAVLGIILLVRPDVLINFLNVIFGALILGVGIMNIIQTVSIIRKASEKWWINLIINILVIGLGIFVIINPFSLTNAIMTVVGLALIATGVIEIVNLFGIRKPKVISK